MEISQQLVYLNGNYLPLSEAKISVLDRGFLFGDGIYEVIPIYSGKPLRLEAHLERLTNSLEGIRIKPPLTTVQWEEIIGRLLDGSEDQYVYLQVTRGVSPKRDHAFPKDPVSPTIFAMCNRIAPLPQGGVSAITVQDTRWHRCDIKAITLLANILGRQDAVEQSAAEAILIRDGNAVEGAASNLFIVKHGTIITPPKSPEILPGITRDLVLELATKLGIQTVQRAISAEELSTAEEIWLTSSTREILPVIRLDGVLVGNGNPGGLWHTLMRAYQSAKG